MTTTAPIPIRGNDERALIDSAAAGDRAACHALYHEHVQQVARHVARLVGQGPDHEDVVQEVWIQVFRSLGRFEHESRFTTWLFRLTANVAIDHLRRRRPAAIELSDHHLVGGSDEIWRQVDARDRVRLLHSLLESADAEQRVAFLMHTVEGMTLDQVGEHLDRSPGTIAAWVSRLRSTLRRSIHRTDRSGRDRRSP